MGGRIALLREDRRPVQDLQGLIEEPEGIA
jgi:hypothetical protein